ncbi:ELM2 domain [Cichlidogyrus casuarinus]|uniref:ELM2 domain n=1 Tax=Cichlidogyrus casuarinus TaxID=1844966 RepID=A0ABD2QI03_9PLAT
MATSTNNNMYRVGGKLQILISLLFIFQLIYLLIRHFQTDYVYFEVSASTPYQVRRIEELNKAPSGDVEAKVACFFRRRDLTNTLLHQAAQDSPEAKNSDSATSSPPPKANSNETNSENGNAKKASLSQIQKHHLKHRELFLSRQVEVLPAKHIRGKCSVTLYNNVEPLSNYLGREDAFYYKLIYDPIQKTLQEDRGTLRIGLEYQCPIQPLLKDLCDPRMSQKWEQLSWNPISTHSDFEMFLTLCRSVGTYARAYDPITLLSSKGGSPQALNLMTAVASANRDMTLQLAHDLLHEANYDLKKAMHLLTPEGRPLMCKDQLDVWSPNEIQLFEEALDKYSKVFTDIHHEYLPWKEHQVGNTRLFFDNF